MKPLTASLLLSAALAATTAASASVTKTIEQTYPLTATGSIKLSNVNGGIEIAAWDENEVSLVAELKAKTQEDLDRISVEIDASPERLVIETKYAKKSSWFGMNNSNGQVHYTLKVPAGVKLDGIESVNSSIKVEGVSGAIRLNSVNGSVKVIDAASDVSVETVNGSIEASFVQVAPDAEIHLETVNGSGTLAVPSDTQAHVKASAVNGRMRSDLPMKLQKSGRSSLVGTLGDGEGGATIRFSSVNGGMTIRAR